METNALTAQSHNLDDVLAGFHVKEQPIDKERRTALLARLKQARPDLCVPPELGAIAVTLLGIPERATVFDPAIGVGAMHLDVHQSVTLAARGADPAMVAVARKLLPAARINERPITAAPEDGTCDYVLGAVPLGEHLNDDAHGFDHAMATGAIRSEVAWLELAIRSVKPGGGVAGVITTEALRSILTPTMRWWLASRAREVARVYLPKGLFGSEDARCLIMFEKRPAVKTVTPLRFVLPWFAQRDRLMSAWTDHLKRHHEIRLREYAASLKQRPPSRPSTTSER